MSRQFGRVAGLKIGLVVAVLGILAIFLIAAQWGQRPMERSFGDTAVGGTMRITAEFLDREGNVVGGESPVKRLAWTTASGAQITQVRWSVSVALSYREMLSPITLNATLTYPTDDLGNTSSVSVSQSVPLEAHEGSLTRKITFDPVDLPTLSEEPAQVPTAYRVQYTVGLSVAGDTRFGDPVSTGDSATLTAELVWQRHYLEAKIIPSGAEALAVVLGVLGGGAGVVLVRLAPPSVGWDTSTQKSEEVGQARGRVR